MRKFAWLSIIVALSLLSSTVSAAEVQTYSKDAFQQAQAAGKPIVVFVTASWCPNCRKQQPVVDTMSKDKAFADVEGSQCDDAEHAHRLSRGDRARAVDGRDRSGGDPRAVPEGAVVATWSPVR